MRNRMAAKSPSDHETHKGQEFNANNPDGTSGNLPERNRITEVGVLYPNLAQLRGSAGAMTMVGVCGASCAMWREQRRTVVLLTKEPSFAWKLGLSSMAGYSILLMELPAMTPLEALLMTPQPRPL